MKAGTSLPLALGLSAFAVVATLASAPAAAAPIAPVSPLLSTQDGSLHQVQWRRRGGFRGGRGYYRGRRGGGGAVAAGVIGGLALGAIIGSAANAGPPAYYPAPVYGGGGVDWVAYCSSKYRSFDPESGTYLGYDGLRHPCQ